MTKEDIFRMARMAGIDSVQQYDSDTSPIVLLERFASLVAQHEREQCARVCEETSSDMNPMAHWAANECARLIRSRDNQ